MNLTAQQLMQKYKSGQRNFHGLILETDANLSYAILKDADFRNASFTQTNLTGVDFSGSNFSEGACLSLCNLSNANLAASNLVGTNLEDSILSHVKLKNKIFSSETRFPKDFNPFLFIRAESKQKKASINDISVNEEAEAIQNILFERCRNYINEQIDLFKDYEKEKLQYLKDTVDSSKKRISVISERQNDILSKIHFSSVVRNQPPSISFPGTITSTTPIYIRVAELYNQSQNSLASYAVGVSQTKESLKLNLQDSSQTNVILAQDSSPVYWIVRDESDDLWLFPKAGWEPSIGTLESFVKLFTFTGKPSRRYQVVKPALVIETSQRNWSLKKTGEIEFI